MNSSSTLIDFAVSRGLHVKCRDTTGPYFRSSIRRLPVDEGHVPWIVPFTGYSPSDYTADSVHGKPWADPSDPSTCKFNAIDGGVDRTSYHGNYKLSADGRPLNPFGRTGLRGRGLFGRWGPNHAADAIVSRRLTNGQLQFVAIERHDTGELALPGGMLNIGEQPLEAAVREFCEETLGNRPVAKLAGFWGTGRTVYRGYVDDHRNTDNAWGETMAVNFHDTEGLLDDVQLVGGDDAKSARWVGIGQNLKLYASHEYLVNIWVLVVSGKTRIIGEKENQGQQVESTGGKKSKRNWGNCIYR
uniref:Nudix hydrolase domain-containing protein n=1 Tax=Globodera rostochiensis TaxID=31243 RepID=A0A914GY43_GLORO